MAYRYRVGNGVYHDHKNMMAGGECQRENNTRSVVLKLEQRSEGLLKHSPGPNPTGCSDPIGLGERTLNVCF